MIKKHTHIEDDNMLKEWHETKQAFGHDIPKNIELEPFSHPCVAEMNARMLRRIKRKHN